MPPLYSSLPVYTLCPSHLPYSSPLLSCLPRPPPPPRQTSGDPIACFDELSAPRYLPPPFQSRQYDPQTPTLVYVLLHDWCLGAAHGVDPDRILSQVKKLARLFIVVCVCLSVFLPVCLSVLCVEFVRIMCVCLFVCFCSLLVDRLIPCFVFLSFDAHPTFFFSFRTQQHASSAGRRTNRPASSTQSSPTAVHRHHPLSTYTRACILHIYTETRVQPGELSGRTQRWSIPLLFILALT